MDWILTAAGMLVLLFGGLAFFYYKKYSVLVNNKFKCSICNHILLENLPLTKSQETKAKELELDAIRVKTFDKPSNVVRIDLNPEDTKSVSPVPESEVIEAVQYEYKEFPSHCPPAPTPTKAFIGQYHDYVNKANLQKAVGPLKKKLRKKKKARGKK